MSTQSLFPEFDKPQIVNVASVPQRSPFRYPGGKTWLVPRIRQWLSCRATKPIELVEPFAGGGIVSLTVAFEGLADRVTLIERDEEVASVWKTVLYGNAEALANRIVSFPLTTENVKAALSAAPLSCEERAFQTILKNRVHRGGILAPGTGFLKNGENGKGIASRWYPETLKQRILAIAGVRDRIRFIEGDGLHVLKENAEREEVVFFIDPPYTAGGKRAGRRLYTHSELDHEELFCIAHSLRGDFLMTYDNTEEIRTLARRHAFVCEAVPMKNTHHAEMTELLITRKAMSARNH